MTIKRKIEQDEDEEKRKRRSVFPSQECEGNTGKEGDNCNLPAGGEAGDGETEKEGVITIEGRQEADDGERGKDRMSGV